MKSYKFARVRLRRFSRFLVDIWMKTFSLVLCTVLRVFRIYIRLEFFDYEFCACTL